MQEIDKEEMMITIGGGVSVTGAMIEAISGVIQVIFGIGQAVGGAIRRISSNQLCKF